MTSVKLPKQGYDPILLDTVSCEEWLRESDDNIVVLTQSTSKSTSATLLKKSYFLNPRANDLYYPCEIENKSLMVDATKQKPLCRNIGYYFQQYSMIPDKLIIRELKKKKNRVFSLLPTGNSELYINQEVLLMTQIGLFKDTEKNKDIRKLNQIHFKKNFPYKKEVYFDSLISQALKNYSWQWDTPINYYLRLGELYFNHPSFTNYSSRYGSTLDEAKKNIKLKINEIDRCFLQAAPRNQNDTKVYYRGMKQGYDFPMNGNEVIIGSEIIVSNYISISTSRNIARQFARRNAIWGQPVTEMCCIYNITID